jgi:hypothetical protein
LREQMGQDLGCNFLDTTDCTSGNTLVQKSSGIQVREIR